MCSAVAENDVRYMCGVFWRGKEETETLFKRLRACEDGVFFQPFWTDVKHDRFNDDEMAAVAARFGVVPKNARYTAVYPCVLGGAWPLDGSHQARHLVTAQLGW